MTGARIPHLPPSSPLSTLQPQWSCVNHKTMEIPSYRKPAHPTGSALTGPSNLLLPTLPSISSPNSTGILLRACSSHCSLQLPDHTQHCSHDLGSFSCLFSHRISDEILLPDPVSPGFPPPPSRTVLGSHRHGCHLLSSEWFPDPCSSPPLRRSSPACFVDHWCPTLLKTVWPT